MPRIGRRHTGSHLLALIFALLLVVMMSSTAHAQRTGEATLDSSSVDRATEQLESLLVDEIRRSGGDPESQRLHLVFGFSTGHFGVEPIRAQAARQTASELVESLLVRGDLVSGHAFEMALWDQPGADRNPLAVSVDVGAEKASVQDIFPLTAQAGSLGGHDTERVLVDLADRVDPSMGPVIVLFTNRAASITTDPNARPLIGQDHPTYQTLLESWRRVESANRSGASLELVYDVERANGELTTNTLDVVLMIPRQFSAPPLSEGTRSERLSAVAPVEQTPPSPSRAGIPIVALVLGAMGVGGWLWLRRNNSGLASLTVDGHALVLDGVRNGEVICELVGPLYPEENRTKKTLLIARDGLPSEVLATFVKRNGKIQTRDGVMRLVEVDGKAVASPMELSVTGEQTLRFEGEVRAAPGLPPKQASMSLSTLVGRGA